MSKKADEWDSKDKDKDDLFKDILMQAKSALPEMINRGNQNHVSLTLNDREMELVGRLLDKLRGNK